jgi:hypothetical protein
LSSVLPRQARDKHGIRPKKEERGPWSMQGDGAADRGAGGGAARGCGVRGAERAGGGGAGGNKTRLLLGHFLS